MKKIIVLFMIGLLTEQVTSAQGIIYLSNLAEPSIGSSAIASNSMAGLQFITGPNSGGYLLDSIQLAMANALGSPNDFTVTVNVLLNLDNGYETYVATLNGSSNPSMVDVYTYMPTSNLVLSPNTYYIVALSDDTLLCRNLLIFGASVKG